MYRENKPNAITVSLPLTTIGFITWIVFMILKLCNLNNPDFNWLTWFWVWFPLWIPWAIGLAVILLLILIALVLGLINPGGEDW